MSITPTVGRLCFYTPDHSDRWPVIEGQPFASLVVAVHSDGRVNLKVFDADGGMHSKLDVSFSDVPSPGHAHCHWIAYQTGYPEDKDKVETRIRNIRDFSFTKPASVDEVPADSTGE